MQIFSNAVPSTSPRDRRAFWAVGLLFSLEAASFALFLPRIPDVKRTLGLSESELGTALLGIPAGTLIGLVIAPAVVRRAGLGAAAWLSVVALAWLFVLPGLAASQAGLLAALFACGIGVSHTEIALNSLAGRVEAASGTRIMSRCHGFWSVGSILGVMAGGALAEAGVPVLLQSLAAGAVLTTCIVATARGLPYPPAPEDVAGSGFARPTRALLPLCLLPVGIMIIEGIFMEWSAVYLRAVLGARPFAAALGFAAFAAAMALVRLSGDVLVARFGERSVVLVSNLAAGVGVLLFATAPTLGIALAGAVLSGTGVALVYPVALSAAARAPGRAERNIAAVSFTSFLILLGSPAAFGFLAESLGFRVAVALCAALVLPAPFLTGRLEAGKG